MSRTADVVADPQQARAVAASNLGTAAKHLGNAEDRINDAIYFALHEVPSFSLEAKQVIRKLSLVLREVGRLESLIRDASPGGVERGPEP